MLLRGKLQNCDVSIRNTFRLESSIKTCFLGSRDVDDDVDLLRDFRAGDLDAVCCCGHLFFSEETMIDVSVIESNCN